MLFSGSGNRACGSFSLTAAMGDASGNNQLISAHNESTYEFNNARVSVSEN